jgi:hypothetical protein
MGSLTYAQRQKAGKPGYRPLKPLPNLVRMRKLSKEIADLHRSHPRFLTPAQARVLIDAIAALFRRQGRLEDRLLSAHNRLKSMQWRTRWTTRIVHARDLDEILEMLLQRRGINGQHIHASAMAKLSAIKRKHQNPNAFRELGKRGAEARWAAHRASQAEQIERLSSKPSAPSTPE